ncbi:cytochrome c oxidase subunit 3 [Planctomycetaceae bacterium SH139]
MSTQPLGLPADRRAQFGGLLFLLSLLAFFLASILLYLMYAYARRGEIQSTNPLPLSFLLSTICLVAISGLLHFATKAVARERRRQMLIYLLVSLFGAIGFMVIQMWSLWEIIRVPDFTINPHMGVAGMVIVLAILHALHVAGGVIALALVTARAAIGRYDHERHWAIRFSAMYWHFLDLIWVLMLVAFWVTSGGFAVV